MKIAVGADHGGYDLKEEVVKHLKDKYLVEDYGTYSKESIDYPDVSSKVTKAIQVQEADLGILICGTGIGMSIAANKQEGIRAALCGDTYSAKLTRQHNDSNVLCLGARVVGSGLALMIVNTWIDAEYEGGRHQNRIDKIEG